MTGEVRDSANFQHGESLISIWMHKNICPHRFLKLKLNGLDLPRNVHQLRPLIQSWRLFHPYNHCNRLFVIFDGFEFTYAIECVYQGCESWRIRGNNSVE